MSRKLSYRLLVAFLWQLLIVALAGPALAQQTNIAAELVAESAAGPGETITLAIHMKPGEEWHGYWLNPGDAGLGMSVEWELPDGAEAGNLEYPVPQTLLIAGLMNHVYKGDYAILVPLKLPAGAVPGSSIKVAADAQWLACTDEICVPEAARLQTEIKIGAEKSKDARFDAWRARLPAPLDAEASFELNGDTVRFGIPMPAGMDLQNPYLFVAQDKIVSYPAPQRFSRTDRMLIVEIARPKVAPAEAETITGVLRLNDAGDGIAFKAAKGTVPTGGKPLESRSEGLTASLPILLAGALLGGLLLNIMPCVFPILSLKALSLARAGENEAQARVEGIAYAGGVIAATMALGAVMLGLRAAGEEIGWAFQLQEPGVVAALLLLAVAITANFVGLFEFTVPGFATEGSPQGAFATGLLAAFVATPCTGPFMAAAMGAALLLPVLPGMALFAALGLGIALPFLAVAFIPALRGRLPKPGPWMNRFRRCMALPMGLTALALLWLASRVGGTDFALVSLALSGAVIALLLTVGRRQRAGKGSLAMTGIGALAIAVAGVILLPRVTAAPGEHAASETGAIAFSQDALDAARKSGKPVFAWFTADWCITCKVNEQVAIERDDTIAAFKKGGVVLMRGDWTRRDPAITRYLTSQGAAGVPLYIWYPADGGPPRQLPQVLTQSMLEEMASQTN